MRSSDTVLGMLQDRGKRGKPVDDLYRQLYNPWLYVRAYGRIYANAGAMTPGSTPETADAMSLATIEQIIEDLRHERYRWTPVRRKEVPKKNGKMRQLGLPTWTDKLLQEVIRSLLEAYYEPQFSDASHGFRPQRGCHTVLSQIQQTWKGVHWFIEGDITACFDRLDHTVLLKILAERIHDPRFLRLIKQLLQAGYLEDWRYHTTLSGAPQGGIVSPILSNIYLNQLDHFMETHLIPRYTRGTVRQHNPVYQSFIKKRARARQNGEHRQALAYLRKAQQLPTKDPFDPTYRRLRYIRYADDMLLGFVGSRKEAEQIKQDLGKYLQDELKLELSQEKTLITHAHRQAARFLSYDIQAQYCNEKLSADGRRRVNGHIALRVPMDVVKKKLALYQRGGKPLRRFSLASRSDYTILNTFQAEYRGFVQYYLLAVNVSWLHRYRWAVQQSLTHTLAAKYHSTTRAMVKRFQTHIETPYGPMKGFEATLAQKGGKPPLVARFGAIPLRRNIHAMLVDQQPPTIRYEQKEVIRRLMTGTCELCQIKDDQCVVHQVRKLDDLRRMGQVRPEWAQMMLKRRRKTLIVCQPCHAAIHDG
ncbi:reverse transcriptase/maturase family protein [Dictyobacter kobayashii]|uniref:Maturase n=1 Tax=Dictyobacter kobayashii TaxID=2014872 RepID=A0A402AVU2_9CHLR|nr:reverse transcriptase/maturase family protein [Dictyobacter kobayashii]GCE23143.1 maturase [Dictyobacter kobayashii]GCE23177.1 maturase [Dictyobacter kobayashii]